MTPNPMVTPKNLRRCAFILTLSWQKPEGFRAKASKGEVVVGYCEPLVTQDLGSSGFPKG